MSHFAADRRRAEVAAMFERHGQAHRGRAMGAYGLGIALAPASGPVEGGLLADHFGWRAVFLSTVPLCLAAIAMAGLAFFSLSAVLMGFASRATGFWRLALWVAIGRVGLGLIISGLNAGALRLLPNGAEAAGSATISFFRQFGGALGVTLLALFLEGRGRQLNEPHGLQAMQESFFLIAFIYRLALIPAWRMTGGAPHSKP